MTEPAEVKTILDGLSSPTPDEAYSAVREYDTRDVLGAVAAKAQGGGGGLPDPITDPVTIAVTDPADNSLTITGQAAQSGNLINVVADNDVQAIVVAGDGAGGVGSVTVQANGAALVVSGTQFQVIATTVIMQAARSEPATTFFGLGTFGMWIDDTPGSAKFHIVALDNNGATVRGSVNLT